MGKKDDLRGLKENVAIGRLIPAGTGLPEYRRIRAYPQDEVDDGYAEEETAQSA